MKEAKYINGEIPCPTCLMKNTILKVQGGFRCINCKQEWEAKLNKPIIEDVFKKMKVLEESFTAVDAIAFPKDLKYHYYDLLDGIASMAKETKRQIELKGN